MKDLFVLLIIGGLKRSILDKIWLSTNPISGFAFRAQGRPVILSAEKFARSRLRDDTKIRLSTTWDKTIPITTLSVLPHNAHAFDFYSGKKFTGNDVSKAHGLGEIAASPSSYRQQVQPISVLTHPFGDE